MDPGAPEGDGVVAAGELDGEEEPLGDPGRSLVVGVALEVGLPGPAPHPSVYRTIGWHRMQEVGTVSSKMAAGTEGPKILGTDQSTPPSPRLTARTVVGPTTTAVPFETTGADNPRLPEEPPGSSGKVVAGSIAYGAAGPAATAPVWAGPPWYCVHPVATICPAEGPASAAELTATRTSTPPARADARRTPEMDAGRVKAASF